MTNIVQSRVYPSGADSDFKRDLAVMLHHVWPEDCPLPGTTIPEAHHKALQVQSFYLYLEGKIVSYAGVVQQTITHAGEKLKLAGLSCVATDPEYRSQGFGSLTITAATEWIEIQQDIDFGIFTCHPFLAPFYQKGGGWSVAPNIKLVGNQEDNALSSDNLDVVVLMRLFSEKAHRTEIDQSQTTINLDFPTGQFL